jgi:hypothetical protein
MSGAPMLLHHCCGELESISFSLDHEDECCEQTYSQITIDSPACCEDEILETALNLEGMPSTISIQFIAPMIGLLENWNLDVQALLSTFPLISFLTYPPGSNLFLNSEELCIFRL